MNKTIEKLAEEYVAHNRSYPYDQLNAQDRYMKNSYLVGYKAAQRWISVTERLPEENHEVLISYGQKPFFLIAFLYYPNHPKKDVKMFCGNNNTNYSLDYVTHWRPLSAPPKEEK